MGFAANCSQNEYWKWVLANTLQKNAEIGYVIKTWPQPPRVIKQTIQSLIPSFADEDIGKSAPLDSVVLVSDNNKGGVQGLLY